MLIGKGVMGRPDVMREDDMTTGDVVFYETKRFEFKTKRAHYQAFGDSPTEAQSRILIHHPELRPKDLELVGALHEEWWR
jgi:hypothetical protein